VGVAFTVKTIVAGSRSIKEYAVVARAIELAPWAITEVVSGKAPGVDTLGELWAEKHSVPVKPFPARWGKGATYNHRAGFMRNEEMNAYSEALVAVWDQASNGTRHMIKIAIARGLRVLVVSVEGEVLFQSGEPGGGSPQPSLW
jgi:hypothetical protein